MLVYEFSFSVFFLCFSFLCRFHFTYFFVLFLFNHLLQSFLSKLVDVIFEDVFSFFFCLCSLFLNLVVRRWCPFFFLLLWWGKWLDPGGPNSGHRFWHDDVVQIDYQSVDEELFVILTQSFNVKLFHVLRDLESFVAEVEAGR